MSKMLQSFMIYLTILLLFNLLLQVIINKVCLGTIRELFNGNMFRLLNKVDKKHNKSTT